MRKTILWINVLVMIVLMSFLTACSFGSDENALKSIEVSGEVTEAFTEGDVLTLDKLAPISVKVVFTKEAEVVYQLGELSALPEGMEIDKLDTELESGRIKVTISYTLGERTKKGYVYLTVNPMLNVLTSLELEAGEINIYNTKALELADLVGLKLTAGFSVDEDLVIEPAKLSKLPEGLTIEGLGEMFEVGKHQIKVSYTFEEITFEKEFTLNVSYEPLPEGTLLLVDYPVSPIVLENGNATAYVEMKYLDDFLIEAYVVDPTIIKGGTLFTNDSIEIAIDKMLRMEGYSDSTLSIIVDAAGNVSIQSLKTGQALEGSLISAEAKLFSLDGNKVDGYKVMISIPYSEVAFTKEAHDAAVVIAFTNANDLVMDRLTVFNHEFGEDYENVHTYAVVGEDGTLEENPYSQLGLVWGNGGVLLKKDSWNIDGDDGTENREIHMTTSIEDNNIYMHHSNKLELLAEAKFSAGQILNNEHWGKFGLTVRNATGTQGLFFYVDAVSQGDGENNHFNENSIYLGMNTYNPEGGWNANWSGIGALSGTSAQYQNGNYVKLAIYRIGSVFALYANDQLIKYASCGIGENEAAYVGIVSFNILLSVKEYGVQTENLEAYKLKQENIDYLFLGDSYMDTAFFYNWGDGFGALSVANIGVGGTKVDYWRDQLTSVFALYQPKNIVVHIGVNDIDDGNTTGEVAWSRLEAMLNEYHAKSPETQIHYITISRNMMFTAKWGEYQQLNGLVKAFAAEHEWVHIVDLYSEIVPENGSTQRWYNGDGLHLGMDGYALLTRMVKESLGLEVEYTGALGDVNVENAPRLVASPGWEELEGGMYHNAGKAFNRVGGESQIFFNGLFAKDFYAEVKVAVGNPNSDDDWAKTGLAIRTASNTYFYILNSARALNGGRTADGHIIYRDFYGNMFKRQDVVGRNWSSELINQYFYLHGSFDHYTDDSYITMGIARIGDDLALFSNGIMVAYYANSGLGDEMAALSVMTFNMEVFAKDAYFTTDLDEIKTKMPHDARIDGNFDDEIYQSEAMNKVISCGYKSDDRHLEFSAVRGTDGIYFKTVIYSYANNRSSGAWWENANVEFRFNNIQHFFYFNGAGFTRTVGTNHNFYAAAGITEKISDNIYRTEVECFVPYSECGNQEEIAFVAFGYVFDEGWSNINNEGAFPLFTLSDKGLRFSRSIFLPADTTISKVTGPTVGRVGDLIALDLELAEGVNLAEFKYNGIDLELNSETGKYEFVMPDENVTITIKFDNLLDASAIAEVADIDNMNPKLGDTITITAKENIQMFYLANGNEEITVLPGNTAQLTITGKTILTGKFGWDADQIEVDLAFEESLYGNPIHFWVEDNRDVTIYVRKGYWGIYGYVVAHTNYAVSDQANWYDNHNLEFEVNGSQHYHVSLNMDNGPVYAKVSAQLLESGQFSGKYEHRYEFFLSRTEIPSWNLTDDIEFGYAYKAIHEPARFEGQSFNQWPRDNFWQTTLGALNSRFMYMYQGEVHPGNLFVSDKGLVDKSPMPLVTLDGELDDELYQGKTSIELGNENAKFIITGFAAPTSTQLAFTIYQKTLAASTDEWWLNDNLEIKYNPNMQNAGFSIFDNFVCGTYQTKSALKRVALTEGAMYDAGYRYMTVVEYFMPNCGPSTIQFGCNGNGFGGWQSLIWDDNFGYVDELGVHMNIWSDQELIKEREGIVTDGIFSEAFYTDEVKALTWTKTAQGSEVSVMGTRLNTTNTIVLGVTVKHNHPITEKSQGDGNEWWNYIGLEIRINWDPDRQIGVTPWNHSIATWRVPVTFGTKTVENQEGGYAYTTTFEMVIVCSGYDLYDCPLCFGGVWNNGFEWLWGFNWVLRVTDHGLVLR